MASYKGLVVSKDGHLLKPDTFEEVTNPTANWIEEAGGVLMVDHEYTFDFYYQRHEDGAFIVLHGELSKWNVIDGTIWDDEPEIHLQDYHVLEVESDEQRATAVGVAVAMCETAAKYNVVFPATEGRVDKYYYARIIAAVLIGNIHEWRMIPNPWHMPQEPPPGLVIRPEDIEPEVTVRSGPVLLSREYIDRATSSAKRIVERLASFKLVSRTAPVVFEINPVRWRGFVTEQGPTEIEKALSVTWGDGRVQIVSHTRPSGWKDVQAGVNDFETGCANFAHKLRQAQEGAVQAPESIGFAHYELAGHIAKANSAILQILKGSLMTEEPRSYAGAVRNIGDAITALHDAADVAKALPLKNPKTNDFIRERLQVLTEQGFPNLNNVTTDYIQAAEDRGDDEVTVCRLEIGVHAQGVHYFYTNDTDLIALEVLAFTARRKLGLEGKAWGELCVELQISHIELDYEYAEDMIVHFTRFTPEGTQGMPWAEYLSTVHD